jgi:serine protease AprX
MAMPALAGAHGNQVSVIVRAEAGMGSAAADAVRRAGGHVAQRISLIHALVARLPEDALGTLAHAPGVASVSRNASVTLDSTGVDGTDPSSDLGSLYSVRKMIGADAYWTSGYTGAGVDVALIDSGIAPVAGMTVAGKVVNGPDLSFESQDPDLRYMDTFGHGTHMAGIIAGRDPSVSSFNPADQNHFLGVAPGARIVSVKVADAFGSTDVVQVLAAIDWVVQHRHDDGLNIRVLNLSFGTNGTQAYTVDPLAYAVEMAWRRGIFVVVSAGNEGFGSPKLNNPAYDPYIMAVGASAPNGTPARTDDIVAAFSSSGDQYRHPDLVAPGKSIVSLRTPGSAIDTHNPAARTGDTPRLFRGSGTSQAAAVVSGAAALVIQQRPWIRPDQLKKLLTSTAFGLTGATSHEQGAGLIDLARARTTSTPWSTQHWTRASGTGSIELARGAYHLWADDTRLDGEKDIFGRSFDTRSWASKTSQEEAWDDDGEWMGRAWTSDGFCATSWAGLSWSGTTWSGTDWAGRSWTSGAWSGRSWTSGGWTGGPWTGRSWTSGTWSGNVWSGSSWGG